MNTSKTNMMPCRTILLIVAALTFFVLFLPGAGGMLFADQEETGGDQAAPSASHGGEARLLPPRPVAEDEDAVNQRVAGDTVDGLVVSVTIDGATVSLDSATPARIPRNKALSQRETGGDQVTATAFASGTAVSTTIVPDNVVNASEELGLVRTTRRQIVLLLASDQPIDTVQIEAPATGASASLDVRSAYADICDKDEKNKWCPRKR